jgi:hypothetical protein
MEMLAGRAGLSAEEGGAAYPFGQRQSWAMGRFSSWAKRLPTAFSSLFFCSFIFPFLISYFIQNLFIIAPNELKSNSKIL